MNFRDFLHLTEEIIQINDRDVFKLPIKNSQNDDVIDCINYYIDKFCETGNKKFFQMLGRTKNTNTLKMLGYDYNDLDDMKKFAGFFFKNALLEAKIFKSYGGRFNTPRDLKNKTTSDKNIGNKLWMYEYIIPNFIDVNSIKSFVNTNNIKELKGKDLYYKITFIDNTNSTLSNKIFAERKQYSNFVYFDKQDFGIYDISFHIA